MVLEANNVRIVKRVSRIPADVLGYARQVLSLSDRDQKELGDFQERCASIQNVEDADEETIMGTISMALQLADLDAYDDRLGRKQRQGFRWTDHLLPRRMVDGAVLDYVQSISGPVPDITFGIDRTSLDSDLKLAHLKPPLPHISEPINGLYWPFLTMEYKSEGKNASITAAVNQCAGAGTACLNSFLKLRVLAPGEPCLHPPIAFTYALTGRTAELLLHWTDGTVFYAASIEAYFLRRPEEFHKLYEHVRCITKWGVSVRWEEISRKVSEFARTTNIPADSIQAVEDGLGAAERTLDLE
ncbi:hypothetical protein B0A49_13860 [Cryomyces minteri]|uniref:DUF7924 domain-containing protein n=1 Tax=Cryomyces minteri TaxID=331657 RepID=A0A4U0VDU0_9PEZI|nr:hypothetical protein B0A49_13860 [Cryomyces minteri]